MLESGIVDTAMAKMLEAWKILPEGSSALIDDSKLKGATQETLTKIADDLAIEVEKQHAIRETALDLDRLRWPTSVDLFSSPISEGGAKSLVTNLPAVMDRMGRFYFRIDDVLKEWFIPGYQLARLDPKDGKKMVRIILESTILYIDTNPICLQVTVD